MYIPHHPCKKCGFPTKNELCMDCHYQANKPAKVSKNKGQAIKPVSKRQAAVNAEKSRIKKRMQAEKNICFTCESAKGETLSHIITAKNKAFELIPRNLVLECRECHTLWEHHKTLYAEMFPSKWEEKLERAKISREHYEKLIQHQPLNA